MAMLDAFGNVSAAAAHAASLSPARPAVSPGLTPTQTPTTAVLLAGEQIHNVPAARQVQVVSSPAFDSWTPRRLNSHKATFSTSSTASTASTASSSTAASHDSIASFSSMSSSASSACSPTESLLALRTSCFDNIKTSDSCSPASYSSPTSSFGLSFAGPNQRAKGPPQPLNLRHSTFDSPKRQKQNLDPNQKHLGVQQNSEIYTATYSVQHTAVSRLEPSSCVSAGVSEVSVSLHQSSPQTALHTQAKATASPSFTSKPSHSPRGPNGHRARASTSAAAAAAATSSTASSSTRARARSVSPYIQQHDSQAEGARICVPSSSVLTVAGAASSSLPQKARSPRSATAVPRTPQLLLFPPQRYSQLPRSAGFNTTSTRSRSATVPSRPGGFNVATSTATSTATKTISATASATTPVVHSSIPTTTTSTTSTTSTSAANTTNAVAPSTTATVLSVAIPSPLLSPNFCSFPAQPASARARLISGVPSPDAITQDDGATSTLRPPRSADFLRSKQLLPVFDSSLSLSSSPGSSSFASLTAVTGQVAYNRNPSPPSPSLPQQKPPALCSLSASVSISTSVSTSNSASTSTAAVAPSSQSFLPALTIISSANAQTRESSMTRPKTHAHHYKSQSESQSRLSPNPIVHVSQHDSNALPASVIYSSSSAAAPAPASASLSSTLSSTSSALRSHFRTRPRAPSDVSGYSSSSSFYTKSLNSRALLLFPPQPLSAKTSAEFSRLQPDSLKRSTGPWASETVESTLTPAPAQSQHPSLAATALNWSHYRSDNMPVNELIDEVDRAFASPTTAPKSAPLYRPATPPAKTATQPPDMLEATQPFPPTAPLLPLPSKHSQASRQIIKMKPRRKKHTPTTPGKASRWTITDDMMQRFRRVEAQEILTEDRLQNLKLTREREADERRRKAEKAKKAQAFAARKTAAILQKHAETKSASASSSAPTLMPPVNQNKSLPPIPEVTLTAPTAVPSPMSHSPSSSISSAASVSTASSAGSTQPSEAAIPPANDEESAEYAPEEDEEYIYFHAAPTSTTAPPFKHGRIRISKAESGIRLPGENALDWTAFQMAILGAGDYYSTPNDNILSPVSEVGDIEELADWLYGMNLPDCPAPAAVAPPAQACTTMLKRHSSSAHGHHMYSYSALRKASESSIDDSASFSTSVSSSASQSSVDLPQTSARLFPLPLPLPPSPKSQPVRNTVVVPAQDHWSKPASVDRAKPVTIRDSGIGMTQSQMPVAGTETATIEDTEYIPMGYNLGHDLGDFLRWEAQHVYAAAPY